MARAKIPVSINGIEFDALISSEHTMEATVPEYPVETGFTVSDTIILNSETLNLVLYLTDYPVTWRSRSGHGRSHLSSTVKKLQELYYSRSVVTVKTWDKTYTDMAIESISFSKTLEVGYAMEVPISLRQIRRTSTSTSSIPAEYGKSGATEEGAGGASTSAGSGGDGSGIGGAGGGGRSGSFKSSILYSAAEEAGLINKAGKKAASANKNDKDMRDAIEGWAQNAVNKKRMETWTKQRAYTANEKREKMEIQHAQAKKEAEREKARLSKTSKSSKAGGR